MAQIKKLIILTLFCSLLLLAACGSDGEPTPEPLAPTVAPISTVAVAATEAPVEEAAPTHEHMAESANTTTADNEEADSASDAQPEDATDSASSDQSAASDDVVMLDIDMHDSYYGETDTNISDPPVWEAKTGQTVIVNLANHGKWRHNWAIVKLGSVVPASFDPESDSNILLAQPGMVYANSQTQWVFRAPEPGEYMVICTVNSHYPTMQGKLIITDK